MYLENLDKWYILMVQLSRFHILIFFALFLVVAIELFIFTWYFVYIKKQLRAQENKLLEISNEIHSLNNVIGTISFIEYGEED